MRITTICALVVALAGAGCEKKEEPIEPTLTHAEVVQKLMQAKGGRAYEVSIQRPSSTIKDPAGFYDQNSSVGYNPQEGIFVKVSVPDLFPSTNGTWYVHETVWQDTDTNGRIDVKRISKKRMKIEQLEIKTLDTETTETPFYNLNGSECTHPKAAQKDTSEHADCVRFREFQEGQTAYEISAPRALRQLREKTSPRSRYHIPTTDQSW